MGPAEVEAWLTRERGRACTKVIPQCCCIEASSGSVVSRMYVVKSPVAYDVGKVKLVFNCGELATRVVISFILLRSVKETY